MLTTQKQTQQQTSLDDILSCPLFKATVAEYLGEGELSLTNRKSCYFVRKIDENVLPENKLLIVRLLLLPPGGFTGIRRNILSVHPEARTVKLRILGAIAPEKRGYKPLIREIEFMYAPIRQVPTSAELPYAYYSDEYCRKELKSWRSWFYAVKEDGWGNFHSLVNLSGEWAVIVVEKELIDHKPIKIANFLNELDNQKARHLQHLLQMIQLQGDAFFTKPQQIEEILSFPPSILVPILIRLLNVPETGKHEPCTYFGLLLKLSKQRRSLVMAEVQQAISLQVAPSYYLHDLKRKLSS